MVNFSLKQEKLKDLKKTFVRNYTGLKKLTVHSIQEALAMVKAKSIKIYKIKKEINPENKESK